MTLKSPTSAAVLYWWERCASLMLAAGIGWMVLHWMGDWAAPVAWGLMFVGAIAKVVLYEVARRREKCVAKQS
jgi:hypothetical protein